MERLRHIAMNQMEEGGESSWWARREHRNLTSKFKTHH